ncbi:MAG: serine/threonine-protein kinase [Gaiellaceae bacterium]
MMVPGDQPVLGTDLVTEGLGAFDELNFLGRGTFGETYHAIRGDDVYAIKVIYYPDMPEHLWEREIAALERVDHPNIVGFRRSGRLSARGSTYPYLECDFVNGGTVRHRIAADEQPSDPAELRTFVTGLLAGVGEIHDLGILHRDIKPENIALQEGDWGSPVLLDFGLARVLDMSSHTDYPALIGTAPYMAPEQLRLQPARRRSDLFAIGVVTYEAGTGQHPFRTPEISSLQSLHDRIQNVLPEDPGSSPAFDEALTTVVLRLVSFREYERLGIGEALRDLAGLDES